MGQIKALQVDWFTMGLIIGQTLQGMPTGPPGLLPTSSKWQLDPKAKLAIESLQNFVGIHLTYRVFVAHKVAVRFGKGPKRMLDFSVSNPKQLKAVFDLVEKVGIKFTNGETAALIVHGMLGQILIQHFVCPEWKWQIPLFTASISNSSASEAATLKGQRERNVDRRSALARAVARERRDRHATAAEVLDRLCGGDVVKEFKDDRVWYWNDRGKLTSVGLDRFETIFSEQAPAKLIRGKKGARSTG